MATTCTECGWEMVSEDGLLTCTKCGSCSEVSNYSLEQQEGFSQSYNTSGVHRPEFAIAAKRNDLRISTSRHGTAVNRWKRIISNGADALRISRVLRELAIQMFEEVFSHPTSGIRARREYYKRGMCAACLHVACRGESLGISTVCEVVQATASSYHKAMKDLRKMQDVQEVLWDRLDEESVLACLRKHKVDGMNLYQDISKILKLSQDYLIHSGRHAEFLILAAAFLSWQVKTPDGFQKRLRDFKGSNVPKDSLRKRIFEVQTMLYSLLKKVPWVDSSKVKEVEAVKYLDDIVKHHDSAKLTQSLSDSEDREGGKTDQDNYRLASFKPGGKRAKLGTISKSSQSSTQCDIPSALRVTRDLDCPELDDNDIPDSEICQYIYQEREKPKSLLNLMEKFPVKPKVSKKPEGT